MSAGALLDGPAPRRAARARLGAAAAWRRVRPALLVAVPLVLAAAALWFAVAGWSAARDDDRIAALEAGRDRPVDPDARPALLTARIGFLAARDRLGETEPSSTPSTAPARCGRRPGRGTSSATRGCGRPSR